MLTNREDLDKDFVDYRPLKLRGSPTTSDWLAIRCDYATFCVAIMKESYSQRSLQNQNRIPVSQLEAQLNDWVHSLPSGFQFIIDDQINLAAMEVQERRTKLHYYFLYLEALLSICTGPRQRDYLFMRGLDTWRPTMNQTSASIVKKILAVSHQLTASDVRSDRTLYRLICIATCTLVVSILRNSGGGDRDDLPYLATATGFFGRMALEDIEGPFEELTEVVGAAQQLVKKKQQK
ncbi:hypothetical protein BJ170DRAFT_687258 [Xylariales sp. AK1849]|nr:hypothetical protein BJ170DRAFT_687258 [Xylariales sp. AK1849]